MSQRNTFVCIFFSGDKLQKYSKNKKLSCIDVPRCKTVLHFKIIVIYKKKPDQTFYLKMEFMYKILSCRYEK